MGNIYRTTYNAFSVVKHSGSIQPQETEKVKWIITIKKLIIHQGRVVQSPIKLTQG